MKALRIDVNFETGQRAANINPRASWHRCHSHWQDTENGVEIRLVLEEPEGFDELVQQDGVELLEGEAAIDQAIQDLYSPTYSIKHEAIVAEYIRQANVDLTALGTLVGSELAEALHGLGCPGIKQSEAPKPIRAIAESLGIL